MKRKERLKRKFLGNGTENYQRKMAQKIMTKKMAQKIMTENYERKLSPSILSRQKVMTYRNTSYLKNVKISF